MGYVFDASSILALTRRLEGKVIEIVKGNLTAPLILYEVGNAIWKECNLLKRLNMAEATKTLRFLTSLLKDMEILDAKDPNLTIEAFSNAVGLGITYYDSVYLTIAERVGGILVTDDDELSKAAKKKGIETLNSKSFPKS